MANVARHQGARPKGMAARENKYIAGGIIYPGDSVKLDNTGRAIVAAAGDALLGVSNSYCSAAGKDCNVFDDPNQLFVINLDLGHAGAFGQSEVGYNYNILATAGDSVYKVSRQSLDPASEGTEATKQYKAVDWDSRPDDALGQSSLDLICAINNHILKGSTGTVGI